MQGLRMHIKAVTDQSSAEDLQHLLSNSDIVVVCCPLNTETQDMLNNKTIAYMPQGSLLINVGRAQIVNYDAVYKALNSGRCALTTCICLLCRRPCHEPQTGS